MSMDRNEFTIYLSPFQETAKSTSLRVRHFFMAPSKSFRPLEIQKENWTRRRGGAEGGKKIQVGGRSEKGVFLSLCFPSRRSLFFGRSPRLCASASNSSSLT